LTLRISQVFPWDNAAWHASSLFSFVFFWTQLFSFILCHHLCRFIFLFFSRMIFLRWGNYFFVKYFNISRKGPWMQNMLAPSCLVLMIIMPRSTKRFILLTSLQTDSIWKIINWVSFLLSLVSMHFSVQAQSDWSGSDMPTS
jgi:hypothetical protein